MGASSNNSVNNLPREAAKLEAFPAIISVVSNMWGTKELDEYLSRLVTDSRDGSRQGFELPAIEDIIFLVDANKAVRAVDVASQQKVDFKQALKMVDQGDAARFSSGDPWSAAGVGAAGSRSSHDDLLSVRKIKVEKKPIDFGKWIIVLLLLAVLVGYFLL